MSKAESLVYSDLGTEHGFDEDNIIWAAWWYSHRGITPYINKVAKAMDVEPETLLAWGHHLTRGQWKEFYNVVPGSRYKPDPNKPSPPSLFTGLETLPSYNPSGWSSLEAQLAPLFPHDSDGPEEHIFHGLKEALGKASDLLTTTMRDMYRYWGLDPDSIPIEAKDMLVKMLKDAPRNVGITPGYHNPLTGEIAYVARNFGHALFILEHVKPTTCLSPLLYLLAGVYAEETLHARWRKQTHTSYEYEPLFRQAFTQAYKQDSSILVSYPDFSFYGSDKDLEETQLEYLHGLNAELHWRGRHMKLHHNHHVDEILIKVLTLEYMYRLVHNIGKMTYAKRLIHDHCQAFKLQNNQRSNFEQMSQLVIGREQQLIPLHADSLLIPNVLDHLLQSESRDQAIYFAQAILRGDVSSVVPELEKIL